MPTDVNSTFDIALFFFDKAIDLNKHLQPQKLQRLLYLSQGYYYATFKRKLMPATFIADERGPMEPNIFIAFSKGRPDFDLNILFTDQIKRFLDSIWKKFGRMSTTNLDSLTNNTNAFLDARIRGDKAEINLLKMGTDFSRGQAKISVSKSEHFKTMRNQAGKKVKVSQWLPKSIK